MKTYNEIKAEYFTELGFPSCNSAIFDMSIGCSKLESALKLERHFEEISKRYAQECIKASLDHAALGLDQETYEYITSEENIILL